MCSCSHSFPELTKDFFFPLLSLLSLLGKQEIEGAGYFNCHAQYYSSADIFLCLSVHRHMDKRKQKRKRTNHNSPFLSIGPL